MIGGVSITHVSGGHVQSSTPTIVPGTSDHLLPLCIVYIKEQTLLSVSINSGSQFHNYWIWTPDV